MTSRTERIAENESVFRAINERLTAWPERQDAPASVQLMFYCECGDQKCFERVNLTASEYEAVRADSGRFALVPGHVISETEHVVEAHDGYVVVEKNADVRDVVEGSDLRRGIDS